MSGSSAGALEHATPALWYAMVLAAMRTGLRYSELIALEWQDVDFDLALLRVRLGNVGGAVGANKVNRIRYIPIAADLLHELRSLPRECDLVFSLRGRWIRHDLARRRLAEFCKRAGVPHVGWHALRHTFASHLVMAGANIRAVQELLGHASLGMTMRYAHVTPGALRAAIDALEERTARPLEPQVWAQVGNAVAQVLPNGPE